MIVSTANYPIVIIGVDRLIFSIVSKISVIICWHNGWSLVIMTKILVFITNICSCMVARCRNSTRSISGKCSPALPVHIAAKLYQNLLSRCLKQVEQPLYA
jgi:hypothetical protein